MNEPYARHQKGNPTPQRSAFSVAPKLMRGVLLSPFALVFVFISAKSSGLGLTMEAMAAVPAPALIGLGVILIALALMAYRVGFDLSPDGKTLICWQGLIVPFHKKRISLPPSSTVGLSMKRTVNRNSGNENSGTTTVITYPVSITSTQGETNVCVLHSYLKGRRTAEQLARLLNSGMLDVARGGESYRDVEGLDEPVGQRYRRLGMTFSAPAAPPEGRLKLKHCDDTATRISIAPNRITFSALFFPLVTCIIATVGLTQQGDAIAASADFLTPTLVDKLANLFKLAVLLQILLLVFGKLRPANIITITRDRVELSISSLWKRSMKSDDIEDVFGPPDRASSADLFPFAKHDSKSGATSAGLAGTVMRKMISSIQTSVIVQGDRRSLKLDSALSIEEAQWLTNAVLHRLVGPR